MLALRRVVRPSSVVRVNRYTTSAAAFEKKEGEPLAQEKVDTTQTTHFGFREIPVEKKEEMVGEVFHSVAAQYDIMNDAMSAGIHRLWKDHFMSTLAPVPGTKLLDVAGGTGDIAFRFLNCIKSSPFFLPNLPVERRSHVTVLDINASMLKVGEERAKKLGYHMSPESGDPHITFVEGNAEKLPIESESVDAYTIAFGIRNCTNVQAVVDEAYRVLRPGGRFMCLEFSHVENPLLAKVYDLYSYNVIPPMGQLLANDWNSYQYLVESIRKFPTQEKFAQMIQHSGFQAVTYENLTFGVTAIHSGFKPLVPKNKETQN